MIRLTIDDKEIEVEPGKTVLEAALQAGIYIPNLCYHPDLPPVGACRLCIVEIEGMKGTPTACTTTVKEGMVVHTNTPKVQELRKNLIWLILSEHPKDLTKSSQLKKVVEWIGVKDVLPGYIPHPKNLPVVSDEPLFIRELNRCILCGRCVRICQEVRGVGTIGFVSRGTTAIVGTSYDLPMKDAGCKFCGACVEVCPSGALFDKEEFEEKDREKILLPCKNSCPAGIDIPRYVRLIAERRFQDALEVIREKVPFPNVLGCVCDHPCEEACRRGEVNEPIAIRALKRFVAEQDSGRWRTKITVAPETGKKVAIVGSGPAGLTAAWFLRKLGHSVTVFEALPKAGGMMRIGIPKYRLPRDLLDREIEDIENIGVKIKTNAKIESLDELFSQGFNAIYLALGATQGIKMGIPGEDNPQVLDGISVLRSINLGEKVDITGDVAVVGGGNVAIDVARCALRVGAEKVTILYRRTQREMPAYSEEVEEALKEGVRFSFLVTPQKVSPEGKKLKVECIRMKLGEPDASGRRRPIPIEGSEFTIEVDRLITAIGQRSEVPERFGLATDRRGHIQVDEETLSCSREGVFAGGDVVSGPASVIKAIQAGRKAAISIDKYLGGKGQIDQKFIPEEEEPNWLGREEGFAYKRRAKTTTLPIDERLHGFAQVELTLDERAAVEEAKRCLRCQLRLNISKAPLPPEDNT
ncbi:FAD-dependent oxidoreductase [bacterium]|nr:FAD-dependent oxidoreductase [bacterium]